MTTLETIERQIENCKIAFKSYTERGDIKNAEYYYGRMEAYKHTRSLIESDKHYKDYSF